MKIKGWVCKGKNLSDIVTRVDTGDASVKEFVISTFNSKGRREDWNPDCWPPRHIEIEITIRNI